jgi:hypothetical protein
MLLQVAAVMEDAQHFNAGQTQQRCHRGQSVRLPLAIQVVSISDGARSGATQDALSQNS